MMSMLPLLMALLIGSARTADEKRNLCCPSSPNNVLYHNKCDPAMSVNISLHCPHGMFMVDPALDPSDVFTVDPDGELLIEGGGAVDVDSYCLARYHNALPPDGLGPHQVAMVCFPDPDDEMHFEYGVLAMVSVVFLVLTLVVYALVPQLRDLQGKCTMCLCGSLGLGFILLSTAQTNGMESIKDLCVVIAFNVYFWLLSAFFWMNIVAINVMRTVMIKNSKTSDSKIFLYYSIYGWGMPMCFLIGTLISHHADGDHVKPGFGDISCWFSSQVATWGYFYVPIANLLGINIILFAITSYNLWRKTSYDNLTRVRSMKYKFFLYVKLFLVTGISWTFEIISYAHNKRMLVWFIADIFNALQGLVFFLLLVAFRKRALKGLAARGCPVPCATKLHDNDEECDEMICDDETVTAMHNGRRDNMS